MYNSQCYIHISVETKQSVHEFSFINTLCLCIKVEIYGLYASIINSSSFALARVLYSFPRFLLGIQGPPCLGLLSLSPASRTERPYSNVALPPVRHMWIIWPQQRSSCAAVIATIGDSCHDTTEVLSFNRWCTVLVSLTGGWDWLINAFTFMWFMSRHLSSAQSASERHHMNKSVKVSPCLVAFNVSTTFALFLKILIVTKFPVCQQTWKPHSNWTDWIVWVLVSLLSKAILYDFKAIYRVINANLTGRMIHYDVCYWPYV